MQEIYIHQIIREKIDKNCITEVRVMESVKDAEKAMKILQEWSRYYELDIQAGRTRIYLSLLRGSEGNEKNYH